MQRKCLWLILGVMACVPAGAGDSLPVRGLHVRAPRTDEMEIALRFIREALPKEGVNTLVVEFDYAYQFSSHPTVATPGALSKAQVQALAHACRDAKVRFIPQINLLGHQARGNPTGLLQAYPEFDETPGLYFGNQRILRSYCPLHPKVHDVVFALVDELADAAGANDFHAGMDEVMLLGEDACPRCKGKAKAELFAGEVRAIHAHLSKRKRQMWIWGDRLLNGELVGIPRKEWDASFNNTHAAIDRIPKDIVICDWHYDHALPTPSYFAVQGFPVVTSPWTKPDIAIAQLDQVQMVRTQANDAITARMLGMLHTTWCGFGAFARAYFDQPPAEGHRPDIRATASALTFRALFNQIRQRRLN